MKNERIGTDKNGAGAKFTPGLWKVEYKCVECGDFFRYAFQVVSLDLNKRVCYCETDKRENISVLNSNATLIAVAPKMYVALCILHDAMLDMGMLPDAVAAIEDVIKEARGER